MLELQAVLGRSGEGASVGVRAPTCVLRWRAWHFQNTVTVKDPIIYYGDLRYCCKRPPFFACLYYAKTLSIPNYSDVDK
eukprot:COSAG01_NODE_3915_length_5542_cov_30.938453_2_plen_79_part_00